jgi:Na+-translocating ferredoxin:NAD+ oxidoreductase RnfG subunit
MDKKTMDLLKANLKDPALWNDIQKSLVKRARITALLLASFLIVSLLALVYGFVQQALAKESQKRAMEQMELCVKEAEKQQALASEAAMIAEEANKVVQEQLAECQKKK